MAQGCRCPYFGGLAQGQDKAFQLIVGDKAVAEEGAFGIACKYFLTGVQGFGGQVGRLPGADPQADIFHLRLLVVEADAHDVAEVAVGAEAVDLMVGRISGFRQNLNAVERKGLDAAAGVVPGDEEPPFVVLFEQQRTDYCFVGFFLVEGLIGQLSGLALMNGFVQGVEPLQPFGIVRLIEMDDVVGLFRHQVQAVFQTGGDALNTRHLPEATELLEDSQGMTQLLHVVGHQGRIGDGKFGIVIAVAFLGTPVDNRRVVAQFAVAHGVDVIHNGAPRGIGLVTMDILAQGFPTSFGELLPAPGAIGAAQAVVDGAVADEGV